MECSQCGFDNLPIARVCGSCGAALTGRQVTPSTLQWSEVTPPRARDRPRRHRVEFRTRIQSRSLQVADDVRNRFSAIRKAWQVNGAVATLGSAVLPGVGLMLLGHARQGLYFVVVAAVLLALMASSSGSPFVACLLAYLTLSAITVFQSILIARAKSGEPMQDWRQRASLGLFIVSIYFSLASLLGWFLGWQSQILNPRWYFP